ncbi:hypothetical protein E4K10_22285 [Streptomyces sp. T1317-0309]|nr:hypothetical protein E4K10_22285 [Streptomyces sp. T1317-0309]
MTHRKVGDMRVFLDVGGHYGETLDVALDPRWGFEKIYSFEPAKPCRRILRGFHDSRVSIVPAGLSSRTGQATLFGAGLLGASVYADKSELGDGAPGRSPSAWCGPRTGYWRTRRPTTRSTSSSTARAVSAMCSRTYWTAA